MNNLHNMYKTSSTEIYHGGTKKLKQVTYICKFIIMELKRLELHKHWQYDDVTLQIQWGLKFDMVITIR